MTPYLVKLQLKTINYNSLKIENLVQERNLCQFEL